ncbi:pentatricopeptide repeat-containing protein [Corchorus olitorius]|uniref:Pentatricopeptide repeat-containing protein n=1 Tax=Corchorus olitorius TaxID=93759 RepID=A0A1R3KM70_9ROSI|nr:pentatricopeptide repeat-containing protein [Corchorus olitorius]
MRPFQIDLRWILPPLLSFLSLTSETKPSFLLVTAFHLIDQPNPTIWSAAFMLLGIFLMLIFLFFSVELSVTLATPQSPISLQARGFSISLLISLLASLLVPLSLFLFAFIFIIATSPWHSQLLDHFIRLFRRFQLTLRSIPTIFVGFTQQHHGNLDHQAGTAAIEVEP